LDDLPDEGSRNESQQLRKKKRGAAIRCF